MPLTVAPTPAIKHVLRTAIPLGDSITAGASTFTDGDWSFGNTQSDRAIWRARMKMLRNAGVGSQTSQQIMARFSTDIAPYSPDAVIILSGTNDILINSYGTVAGSSFMNYIEQMVMSCLANGIFPVLVAPPAKKTDDDGIIADLRWQRYFYYMLAEYYGIPLVDYANITMNPLTASYIDGYSQDGVHPYGAPIDLCATQIANVLKNPRSDAGRLPHFAIYNEQDTQSNSNLIFNGLFLNLTGTDPANSPLGWQLNGDTTIGTYSTTSLAGVYPYNGNQLVYTKVKTDLAYFATSTQVSPGATTFQPGDTMLFTCRVVQSNMGAFDSNLGFYVNLNFKDNVNAIALQNQAGYNEDYVIQNEFVVPPDAVYLQVNFITNQTGIFAVNNVTLINVTKKKALWKPGKQ